MIQHTVCFARMNDSRTSTCCYIVCTSHKSSQSRRMRVLLKHNYAKNTICMRSGTSFSLQHFTSLAHMPLIAEKERKKEKNRERLPPIKRPSTTFSINRGVSKHNEINNNTTGMKVIRFDERKTQVPHAK